LPTTRRSLSWGSRTESFVCQPGRGALVAATHVPSPLSEARDCFLIDRPLTFWCQDHSSSTMVPFRVPSLDSRLLTFRPQTLPTRVPALFATSQVASTYRESFQALTTFRPQAFSASRRFAPPSGFTGLFHPVATSRVRPVQGLLSPRSATTLVEWRCPLVVEPPALTRPKTAGHAGGPRLRGLGPREAACTSKGD